MHLYALKQREQFKVVMKGLLCFDLTGQHPCLTYNKNTKNTREYAMSKYTLFTVYCIYVEMENCNSIYNQ